jgi:hypothetical protein
LAPSGSALHARIEDDLTHLSAKFPGKKLVLHLSKYGRFHAVAVLFTFCKLLLLLLLLLLLITVLLPLLCYIITIT